MTIEYRNSVEPGAKTGMDPKTRTAIAAGALLVCLLVGAGIVYWLLVGSSPKRRVVEVDPAKQAPARPEMRMAQRRDVPGIHRTNQEWIIRSNDGEMRVRHNAASATDATFRFPRGLRPPPEQNSLAAGHFRILHDEAMAAEWKVTPDQLARLKQLQLGGGEMNPSTSQRQELWNLWQAFNKASGGQAKVDAQKKLIDKLEEVTKSLLEPAKQQYAIKVDQIKTILTPEQVKSITGK